MWLALLLVTGSALNATPPLHDGVIEGVVVRAADHTPVARAEVVLRAKVNGRLVPVAETTADAMGRFRFAQLPVGDTSLYVPGANRGDIHYPGPSVKLSSARRRAEVTLKVHEAVTFPNPLVVRRHTITLEPEPGVLRVTESMLIDNPSTACYVGQAAREGVEPVTLQLAIPTDFSQVTFASEFFGRRFSLGNGKLVTSVPWPPGQREVTFSYLLANTQRNYVWQRPLDLPSAKVRVLVRSSRPEPATSDLSRTPGSEDGEVAFDSGDRDLPAGYMLRVELRQIPVSLMRYAPWLATLVLIGLLLATHFSARRLGRRDIAPSLPDRQGRADGNLRSDCQIKR
jgi:hypothetical protein